MTRWHKLREEGEVLGIYRTLLLEKNYKLRMDVTWFPAFGDAEIAILAYKGRFEDIDLIEKEGQATGPGGVEVFGKALDLLTEAEQEIIRRYDDPRIVIHAASEKLYRIYAARLIPRGYTTDGEVYDDPWPSLVKRPNC